MRPLDDFIRDGIDAFLHLGVVDATTDQSLRRIDRIRRIRNRLALGELAREPFTTFRNCDDRRRSLVTGLVRDDKGFSVFDDGDTRIRRAKVDSNGVFRHSISSLKLTMPAISQKHPKRP